MSTYQWHGSAILTNDTVRRDRSRVACVPAVRNKWLAWWPDGTLLRGDNDMVYYFDSAEEAIAAIDADKSRDSSVAAKAPATPAGPLVVLQYFRDTMPLGMEAFRRVGDSISQVGAPLLGGTPTEQKGSGHTYMTVVTTETGSRTLAGILHPSTYGFCELGGSDAPIVEDLGKLRDAAVVAASEAIEQLLQQLINARNELTICRGRPATATLTRRISGIEELVIAWRDELKEECEWLEEKS